MHEHGLGCGRRVERDGARSGPRPFRLAGARPDDPPDRPVAVRHYALDVTVDIEEQRLAGRATLTLEAVRAVDHVRLDAVELDVREVAWANGPRLAFEAADDALVIRLDAPLAAGARRDLVIDYAARPRRGLHFVRPDNQHPRRTPMAWTQGQDEDARAWFPCLDRPFDRATTEVTAEVQEPLEALSNGVRLGVEPGARPGWRRFRWRLDRPHPPYLVTLVVGKFETLQERWEDVPLAFHAPPERAALAPRTFGPTKAMVAFLSGWTGVRYPWPRYDQVVVEEFIFGGMENTSQTTLTARTLHDATVKDDFSSDPLVVHELAHQWFGDLVTCREWAHAWLNEGFATYCQALWEEHARGPLDYEATLLDMRDGYLEEAGERYARPIVTRVYHAPIDLFDRHLYEKGAQVLHHLRGLLGDDGLRASIKRYLERHALGPVETIDLRRAIHDATGRDLTAFFRRWVHRAGHPALKVSFEHDLDAGLGRVTVEQTQERPFGLDLELVVVRGQERVTHRLPVRRRRAVFSLPMLAPPDRVVVDPRGLPCMTLELALPEAMLRATLAEEPGLFPRVRAAEALAKKGGRGAIDALRQALTADPHWGLGKRLAAALGKVGTSESRRALEGALASVAHPRTRAAIATALGDFTGDAAAGDVLATMLRGDRSPLVEAAAAKALGRARAPGALELLAAALKGRDSWNDVVRAGCLAGLAALFDAAGVDLALAWLPYGKDEGTRAAAARALGALADSGGAQTRTRALDALRPLLRDPQLRVRLAAIDALEATGDARALGALEAAAATDVDRRARRHAREAARSLRDGHDGPSKAGRLRKDVDQLREETRRLRDQVERLQGALDARLPPAGPRSGLPGRGERDPRDIALGSKDVIRGNEGLQEG